MTPTHVPRFPALPRPVAIEIVQDHAWKSRGKSRGKNLPGCAVCGEKQLAFHHLGAPRSLNHYLSSAGVVYTTHKAAWTELIIAKLEEQLLPKGLEAVKASGRITFPRNQASRDEGNFRFFLEKMLGDALVKGGWLSDDDWYRYEFGRVHPTVVKGLSRSTLYIEPQIYDEDLAVW